jgi:DNA-binding MarR family transcriptional regulator
LNFAGPLPGRPLTPAQRRALIALVEACPTLGQEVPSKAVADAARMAGGATTLALRGLERRQLVVRHDVDEECWSPTLPGRARARELTDRAARIAAAEEPVELGDASP